MKKLNTLLLALSLISTPTFAKSNGSAKAVDTATYTRSAPQSGGGSSYFGLGVTTFTALGGTGGISALLPVGQHSIQMALVLGTSGGFSLGASGLFKATVAGTGDTGFHIGGGLGMGVTSSTTVAGFTVTTGSAFALMLGGVLGFHHEIVANKIAVSFDAGPVIAILPSVSFSLAPLSTFGGLSVHYLL